MLSTARDCIRRFFPPGLLGRIIRTSRRQYNLGSSLYHEAFKDLPPVDRSKLRDQALTYLSGFDRSRWYDDPIHTIIVGKSYRFHESEGIVRWVNRADPAKLPRHREEREDLRLFDCYRDIRALGDDSWASDGDLVETTNAFGEKNGAQYLSTPGTVDVIIRHLKEFKSSSNDNREGVRKMEEELFGPLAGELIGNQAVDFKKQDGITEIEEALEAGAIERRLNDKLFDDESHGRVSIKRSPAFVSCVSNFSNFLDLSRKVLRNIELGVPVCILSRTNTTQHMFRWTQMLLNLMKKYNIDLGYVTYASCDISSQQRIFANFKDSPMYFTGSREVAKALKSMLKNTMSSTGGPNTLISTTFDDAVQHAIRTSALLEHAGQCTALRHAILPNVDSTQVREIFAKATTLQDEKEAIEKGEFASLLNEKIFEPTTGYERHHTHDVEYKVDTKLPVEIEEGWRKAIVDVTSVSDMDMKDSKFIDSLNDWLIEKQPISLAINGDSQPFNLARKLFEETALVVYTVGSPEAPALTAQARPQDGEIFGEVPPRKDVDWFTKFPTIVPSPTPGYHAEYTRRFLDDSSKIKLSPSLQYLEPLIKRLSTTARGYALVMIEYLIDACSDGPRKGFGSRTALYGLQRPPLKSVNIMRVTKASSIDSVILQALPFLATNADVQLAVSSDGSHAYLKEYVAAFSIDNESAFESTVKTVRPYNVLQPSEIDEYPLVSHFVTKALPIGHIKSTRSEDDEFIQIFKDSPKWLCVRERKLS